MGCTAASAPNYKCKLSDDQTRLVNLDGSEISPGDPSTGTKSCGACLNDALVFLYGASCTNASSPDCDPASCQATTSACLSDLP